MGIDIVDIISAIARGYRLVRGCFSLFRPAGLAVYFELGPEGFQGGEMDFVADATAEGNLQR